MEEQIASLAGLVHRSLSLGPDVHGVKDTVRSVHAFNLTAAHPLMSLLIVHNDNRVVAAQGCSG